MTKVWTEEAVEKLTTEYNGQADNERLAEIGEQFGVTAHAVRSKLVSMKIYEKNEPRSVGGASSIRKAHLVRKVANALNAQGLESLEKATKQDLETLLELIGQAQATAFADGEAQAELEEIE